MPALRSDGGRRPATNALLGLGSIAELLPIQVGAQREVSRAMSPRKSIRPNLYAGQFVFLPGLIPKDSYPLFVLKLLVRGINGIYST